MNEISNNHRQEARLDCSETIFIEIQHRYHDGGESSSRLLICNSVDLSANGIQAQIDEALPINAIYQLCVELTESGERLFLVAQVKWLRPVGDGAGFYVGLMIFESDDTDVERWKLHIADRLSHQA